ncbi:lipopolysaccharide kinase InaA family protein [Pseudomonas sp.]|uniref:lipopolysaccharide kinase InaA family protein n=1 Tax=Pseudomonas sp. TaxID=306 RepID=UPI003567A3B5
MSSLITRVQTEPVPSTFERWWQVQGEWVEAPNQRRGGESGVQRRHNQAGQLLYLKRQTGHLYRSWLHPLGRPTALRELHAMEELQRLGIRVPKLVYAAAQKQAGQWRALLVTEALEGFVSLEQWYTSDTLRHGGTPLNRCMLEQLAAMLSRLHRAGWQHGCLYPKHIFIKPQAVGDGGGVEVALLDLEKSRRRLFSRSASRRDMGQLSRHRGGMPAADWQLLLEAYHRSMATVGAVSHEF